MSPTWLATPRIQARWVAYGSESLMHALPAGRRNAKHFPCGKPRLPETFERPDVDRPHCQSCEAFLVGSDSPAGAGEAQEAFRG